MKPTEYYNYSRKPRSAWWLPLVVVLVLTPIVSSFRSCHHAPEETSVGTSQTVRDPAEQGWHTVLADGTLYSVLDREYTGEFDLQPLRLAAQDVEAFSCQTVMTAEEYRAFCTRWKLTPAFAAHGGSYAVVAHAKAEAEQAEIQLGGVSVTDGTVKLLLRERFSGSGADCAAYVLTVPVDASVTALETEPLYLAEEVGK